jgi:hypothetical protein
MSQNGPFRSRRVPRGGEIAAQLEECLGLPFPGQGRPRLFPNPGGEAADHQTHREQSRKGDDVFRVVHNEGIEGRNHEEIEGEHAEHRREDGRPPSEKKCRPHHHRQIEHDQVRGGDEPADGNSQERDRHHQQETRPVGAPFCGGIGGTGASLGERRHPALERSGDLYVFHGARTSLSERTFSAQGARNAPLCPDASSDQEEGKES